MNDGTKEIMDIGKVVGHDDALIEEVLREGLMNPEDASKLQCARAMLIENFRATLGRTPEGKHTAQEYFAELSRIMNVPRPHWDEEGPADE